MSSLQNLTLLAKEEYLEICTPTTYHHSPSTMKFLGTTDRIDFAQNSENYFFPQFHEFFLRAVSSMKCDIKSS